MRSINFLLTYLLTYLISGVVHGSGIGPLMFLIFINELAEIRDSAGVKVKLFADDVKVYVQIVSSHDSFKLQCALDLLTSWAQTWQLIVFVDKCCILNIGRAKLPVMDFCIDGKILSTNLSCRDLGVIISHDLKPAMHIGQMVAKAHQRANMLYCVVLYHEMLRYSFVRLLSMFVQ